MSYLFTVTTIARSAAEVLAILDRQARRDVRKTTRFIGQTVSILTGRQAAKTYRALWNLLVILGMVAIACGMTVRDWLNAYVDSCLDSPIESIPDPWELPTDSIASLPSGESDPEALPLLPAPPAMLLLMPPASVEHRVIPFVRPVRSVAQQLVTVMKSEVWAAMSPYDLRKECGKRDIRWRNAHGKNRHLSKPEMVVALIAADAAAIEDRVALAL